MKALLLASGLALALSGCVTQNIAGTSSYQPVSTSRIIGFIPEPASNDHAGIIIVKRDPGKLGSAIESTLLIDGQPVARIEPGEYLQFRSHLGEHIFGVSWSDNLGPAATSSTRELAVDVKPGQTYYLRMFPQAGAGIVIERTSQ